MTRFRIEHGLVAGMAVALTWVCILGEGGIRGAEMAIGLPFMPLGGGGVFILLAGLVVLNAMFVASAAAIDLLRPFHAKYVKEGNARQSEQLRDLIDRKATYLAACGLASRLTWLGLGLLVLLLALGYGLEPDVAQPRFDSNQFFAHLAMIGIPVLLVNLIIGDLVPKSYATLHPHGVGLRLYVLVRMASAFFSIPATLLVATASLVTRLFGGRASFTLPNETEEEIRNLVDSAQEAGVIEDDEKEMLHSVFEFSDKVAREAMTPRIDLDAMPITSAPEEIVTVIRESGHTRIPLYEGTDDSIVGIIHAKDLLMALVHEGPTVNVRSLMRRPLFVSANKNLSDLLGEMRLNRTHMAIVQDEYGGTAGVVTMEDIVEELVGDIVDEYDQEEPDVVADGEDAFLVAGQAHLDDVNRLIGSEFESEQFDTIGGFVFGEFGRQPRQGESAEIAGYRVEVVETDGRRIQRLRLEALPSDLFSALDAEAPST